MGSEQYKSQGVLSELLTAAELVRHGFGVSWPVGDNERYDLIATYDSTVRRIQVKGTTTKTKHGTYRISLCHGHSAKVRYTDKEVDFAVAVIYYTDGPAFYIIPIKEAMLHWRATFFAPGRHPTFPKKWKCCRWEDFRDRWDLLR